MFGTAGRGRNPDTVLARDGVERLASSMTREHPRLRYLEALPHSEDGNQLVVLRDPTHVSDRMLAVSPDLYSLLASLDGSRSIRDLQLEWSRRCGDRAISEEEIGKVLRQLGEVYFLENENFHRRRSLLLQRFRGEPVRTAFHAGTSYPEQQASLLDALGAFYAGEKGAGLPGRRGASRLRALVAPHIDLRLGGATYTHAYRTLAESRPPDVFVILGTAHMGLPRLFSICRKDFQTPLGTARLDRELLAALDDSIGDEPFHEELAHRSEHSIEFQVVFLQHLFPESDLRILPVLTSFAYSDLEPLARGDDPALLDRFLAGLRQAERRTGKSICFVASVDLAHIGPRYGDPFQPDSRLVEEVSEQDREMLRPVIRGDAEGFRNFVRRERDQRRICGFSPLYTMLRLLEGSEGRLLAHDHSQMDPSGSFVTYASLVYPGG